MIASAEQAMDFFHVPQPWTPSPDAEAADAHALAWAKETGLVRSQRTLDLVASWRIGDCVACSYPRARGKYLDFIADWVMWGLVFDDIFDYIVGEPRRVAEILARTRSILHADPHTAPPQPLLGADRALRDMLMRAAEMTSPQWMTQFRHNMDTFFRGVLDKSMAIAAPGPVDVPTALAIRRDDIGMKAPLDFIEMFEEFMLPPVATGLRSFRWLRVLVCDAVVIQNDICSFIRDNQKDSPDSALSLIHALDRVHGQGKQHAVLHARQMYVDKLTELDTAGRRFIADCETIGLCPEAVANAQLYVRNAIDQVHGVVMAHVAAAARGYLNGTPSIPALSELLADYDPPLPSV
jgi:hypothetical protein